MRLHGKPKVALIAGATASGKSSLAMEIGEAVNGTVINADSAQVYADLRALTARPSEEEEAALPHRLFGYIDGAIACSAGRWARDAKTALLETHEEGRIPIVVGGTGFYQRVLLEGIAPIPDINADIRTAIRGKPAEENYAALRTEDPDRAAQLDPGDTNRIARALEVVRSTGKTIGAWQKEKAGGITGDIDLVPLVLLPDREWLYDRCNRRFEAMFDEAMREIETLLARKLDPGLPVMRSIGVPELATYLHGDNTRAAAIAAAQQATRRYAKRQYTWFAHQPPGAWPRICESEYNEWISKIVTKLQ